MSVGACVCGWVLVDCWQFAMCEGALSEVQPTMWKHTSLLPRIVQSSCWPCRGWLCTQRTCGRVCRGLKQPPQTVHGGSPSEILAFRRLESGNTWVKSQVQVWSRPIFARWVELFCPDLGVPEVCVSAACVCAFFGCFSRCTTNMEFVRSLLAAAVSSHLTNAYSLQLIACFFGARFSVVLV